MEPNEAGEFPMLLTNLTTEAIVLDAGFEIPCTLEGDVQPTPEEAEPLV